MSPQTPEGKNINLKLLQNTYLENNNANIIKSKSLKGSASTNNIISSKLSKKMII
jgi:hypothetical protein